MLRLGLPSLPGGVPLRADTFRSTRFLACARVIARVSASCANSPRPGPGEMRGETVRGLGDQHNHGRGGVDYRPALVERPLPDRLQLSDHLERLRLSHDPAQGAVFVQVAEPFQV